jgi:cytochrome b subunit of formate dehydrogenase
MKLVFMAWLAGLLGFALLVTGVALIYQPAAFIVAGICLVAWARRADKASAAQRAQGKGG